MTALEQYGAAVLKLLCGRSLRPSSQLQMLSAPPARCGANKLPRNGTHPQPNFQKVYLALADCIPRLHLLLEIVPETVRYCSSMDRPRRCCGFVLPSVQERGAPTALTQHESPMLIHHRSFHFATQAEQASGFPTSLSQHGMLVTVKIYLACQHAAQVRERATTRVWRSRVERFTSLTSGMDVQPAVGTTICGRNYTKRLAVHGSMHGMI